MKKTNFILPTIAFLIATGAALAAAQTNTQTNTEIMLVSVRVSLPPPFPCADIGSCTLGGTSVCTTPGGTPVREYFAVGICGNVVNGTWDD
jgi:hypothetical protein